MPFVDLWARQSSLGDAKKLAGWDGVRRGSHMEILAAARLFNVNFSIHQVGQPRWELMGAPQHAVFYHL